MKFIPDKNNVLFYMLLAIVALGISPFIVLFGAIIYAGIIEPMWYIWLGMFLWTIYWIFFDKKAK